MSLQFLVIAGPDKGRALLLHAGTGLMLGRGARTFYQLSDPSVSRNHCEILKYGDDVTVVCAGARGGTCVNGKQVQRQALKLGDVLHVGDSQLRLQVGELPLEVALAHAPAHPAPAALAAGVRKLACLSGQTLAHYVIGPVLGSGQTGMVFHATDTKDNRPVAFKVLLPEFSRHDEELQRFVRAMRTTLPLRHPHLVTLYAAGKTGPHCWVAMEYVAGENMKQVIDRIGAAGMLDWRYAFKVALQVGQALAYAHGQQILHRNVTPRNVLLDAPSRDVKLGDLMFAKALEGVLAQQITRPEELVGDVSYMAPERTRGQAEEVDARSDLYGLGATTYALLAGRPPFEGATLVEKITRIRQGGPERPTKYHLSIPAAFEGVVLKLLACRPEDRYQSAAELLRELERVGRANGVPA